MQDGVSRKRAKLPSPAMVVAIIALVMATAGSAYAVKKSVKLPRNSVGAKQLKRKAVTTGKIRNNQVKTNNIADHSLTGQDINLLQLGTVPSATEAAQTGDVGTITGHAAACPGGTTLIRGVCFDSSSNPAVATLAKARDACAAKGGYLPSPLKLWSAKDVLNLGTGVGTDRQYTDTYYDKPYESKKEEEEEKTIAPSTITVDGKGTLTEQSVNDPAEYTCVYPLVR
jgi:hypothetical protein